MGVIYLVRHGQADPVAYGITDASGRDATDGGTGGDGGPGAGGVTGAADGEPGGLTAVGAVQAQLTGRLLAGLTDRIDAAVSGDLARQRQTLAGVLAAFDAPGPPPTVDPAWNEYELPALVGDATAAEFADGRAYQQRLDAALAEWISQGENTVGAGSAPNGSSPNGVAAAGESYSTFRSRVRAAAERAAALAGSGRTVLVVSSAGTITQLIAELWDVPAQRWPVMARTMVNASVSKLIVGRRGISVVSFNEHAHLADRDGGVSTFR
ncbi:histidine phosphatase family protein [Gordonia sinesedis]